LAIAWLMERHGDSAGPQLGVSRPLFRNEEGTLSIVIIFIIVIKCYPHAFFRHPGRPSKALVQQRLEEQSYSKAYE
jgi:hypothetical protein